MSTAWHMFLRGRKKAQGVKFEEFIKQNASIWNSMPHNERQVFYSMASAEKNHRTTKKDNNVSEWTMFQIPVQKYETYLERLKRKGDLWDMGKRKC